MCKTLKDSIQGLSDSEFFEIRNWMNNEEKKRRESLIIEQAKKDHIKKIKSFRNGHKLVVMRDVYYRNKVVIPATTIVKKSSSKGKSKYVTVLYTKKDEEWDIPMDMVGDAENPEDITCAEMNQAFAGLFK